jgi:hypothetical protein
LVVLQHINTDSRNVIAVTFDWLSNHMLSESIEVRVLKCQRLVLIMVLLMVIGNFYLQLFKFGWVESCVADSIPEH